jgi:cytochrome c553
MEKILPIVSVFKVMRRSLLLFVALFFGMSGAFVLADDSAAIKRGAAKAFYCTGCHGYNGMGSQSVPALAGQDKKTLLDKMMEFKKKKSSVMGSILVRFGDHDFNDLAAYFASLKKTGQGEASFARDILPILQWRCSTCHTKGGEGTAKSGLELDSYASLMAGTTQGGDLIVAGDATSSSFMVMVTRKDHLRMPFGAPPLADDEIRVIRTWIEQGARNN